MPPVFPAAVPSLTVCQRVPQMTLKPEIVPAIAVLSGSLFCMFGMVIKSPFPKVRASSAVRSALTAVPTEHWVPVAAVATESVMPVLTPYEEPSIAAAPKISHVFRRMVMVLGF